MSIVEEVSEDSWSDLPEELACEIITRITDLRSLLNYMQSSKTFYRLAHFCTRVIDSSVKVKVLLSYFAGFVNLQVIGEKILVMMSEVEVPLLSSLKSLRAANLYYLGLGSAEERNPSIRVERARSEIFSVLASLLRGLDLHWKIPQVNFKIIVHVDMQRIILLIQGNSFSLLGINPILREMFEPLIREIYPELQYIETPGVNTDLRLISRGFRNFLREGDFGLFDPSRPPSETNPPLSDILQRLADSGLILDGMIHRIISIYADYHGLSREGVIYFDELMTRYIEPAVIQENLERTQFRPNFELLPLGQITRYQRSRFTSVISSKFTSPSQMNIEEYDLPSPISREELNQIQQQIRNTYMYYQSRQPFYRTDGTLVK